METIIDREKKEINIYNDEGERVLSVLLFDKHAIFEKIGDEDIILDSSNPSTFYENIRNLFDNQYVFAKSGNQAKNLIVFVSDDFHPVHLESSKDLSQKNRLILKLDADTEDITVTVDNSSSNQEEDNKRSLVFIDSEAQNAFRADEGEDSLYEQEQLTLQKDMIEAIKDSFISKSYLPKRFKFKKTA